jgi:hypothetical protein
MIMRTFHLYNSDVRQKAVLLSAFCKIYNDFAAATAYIDYCGLYIVSPNWLLGSARFLFHVESASAKKLVCRGTGFLSVVEFGFL